MLNLKVVLFSHQQLFALKELGSECRIIIPFDVLQFHGIAVSDAGRYLCHARNPAGEAEAVAEVVVSGK